MALSSAILVCLTDGPMTGYDLAKTFDTSIGFFWRADHQQIYRELAKLRDAGHVSAREVVQTGKPDKIVYSLTAQGRRALRTWSTRASAPPTVKDEMLVKFYALEHVDIAALREQVAMRLEHHQARLQRYQRIMAKNFGSAASSPTSVGRRLGLELGLMYERGWVDWCELALKTLASSSTATNVARLNRDKGKAGSSPD